MKRPLAHKRLMGPIAQFNSKFTTANLNINFFIDGDIEQGKNIAMLEAEIEEEIDRVEEESGIMGPNLRIDALVDESDSLTPDLIIKAETNQIAEYQLEVIKNKVREKVGDWHSFIIET